MAAQLSTFTFQQSQQIRTFLDENGNPYFCLADICHVLELTNPSKIASQIKEEFSMGATNKSLPFPSVRRHT